MKPDRPALYRLMSALVLCLASPAYAAEDSDGQAPLAEHTATSGAPLGAVQSVMELSALALSLAVDPDTQTISGVADYTVRVTAPVTSLEFDLDPRLPIEGIALDGQPVHGWANKDGLLTIPLGSTLEAGAEKQVAIVYSGKPIIGRRPPWDPGMVWSKTEDGTPWIATAVQASGCDLFWPCIDHPKKRVQQLDLIVTVPKPLVVAANGKLVETITGHDRRTYLWRAREPNTYGVSLQIGPYETVETQYASRFGNTIPMHFYHLPGHEEGAKRLVAELEDYLDFFESVIGPYPFGDEKVGIAETPHLGMEHQTINAYGNGFKLAPEGYDWLMQHEFSHEWFANQLTNAETADMWLQEGIGTYMQPLYLEWKDGKAAYQVAMWDRRKQIFSKVPVAPRSRGDEREFTRDNSGWGADIYYKGAWIMHTLRGLVGDDAFFEILRRATYGRPDPKPGNFTTQVLSTDGFFDIARDVTGQDLNWFEEAYFRTAALPKLITTRTGTTLDLAWEADADIPFAMPLELTVDGAPLLVAMEGGTGSVTLPRADAHVVFDPEAKVLKYDPAIEAWRAQEEANWKAAAQKAAEATK